MGKWSKTLPVDGFHPNFYTYCYEHGKSLPSNGSLIVGKRVLQGRGDTLECTRRFHVTSRAVGETIKEPQLDHRGVAADRLEQLGSFVCRAS
ncbi:hypothetical protein AVEN_28860-1 [Araneus ventricosus]|uniref:Uncharacterized protein n=1 Tax=Araneus ventricosus TaxID=182803 RepID=A0A4Y2FKP8_ARAVE|nr:hypothetical protein AVEN_28860-1 [Araneus ventricosus]